MRITEAHPLALVAIPVGLVAFNGILKQIGLNPIDYSSWQIWTIFICVLLSSVKLSFK